MTKKLVLTALFLFSIGSYGQEFKSALETPFDSLYTIYKDGVPILENVYSINNGLKEPHIPVNLQDGLVDTNAIWSGHYLDSLFKALQSRIEELDSLMIKENQSVKISK